ncbi:MAG: histidine kinase [Sporocytophaga sp.]|uniref:sensor histidine kinase n=1 Tax=Sporocytophaga sp. TaxID=2231183 RepID=UPI001B03F42F|nr:sensor histidine kinase [Sporocytophaga sp.]MBO9702343.1 histidine kinase [Sporocytophaga sp.]
MFSKKLFFLIFILLISFFFPVFSQKLVLKNITSSNGLPSNVCYDIIQDTKGYIWIASESGVGRFDGNDFKYYTTQNGLADNEIFKIVEDHKGRIWFLSYNGQLSYYYNGVIHHSGNTPFLKKLSFTYLAITAYSDHNGNVWFSSKEEGIKVLLPNNSIKIYSDNKGTFDAINIFVQKNDTLIAASQNRALIFTKSALLKKDASAYFYSRSYRMPELFKFNAHKNSIERNDFSIKAPAEKVLCYLKDSKENSWFGTGNGLFHISHKRSQQYLTGTTITSLIEDSEGNVWISTLGKGIYMAPSLPFFELRDERGQLLHSIISLYSDGDIIYAGTDHGTFYIINRKNNDIKEIQIEEGQTYNRVKRILTDDRGTIWIGCDVGLYKYTNTISKVISDVAVKDLSFTQATLLVASNVGLFSIQNEIKKLYHYRTTEAAFIGNTLYVGTLGGLKTYSDSSNTVKFSGNTLQGKRITSIENLAGYPAVATYGHGLYILHQDTTIQITESKGLNGDIISELHTDKNNNIWLLTNRGLNYFDIPNQKIISYSGSEGLLPIQLSSFCLKQDTVFVASERGLSYFIPSQASISESSPQVFITSMEVNNAPYIYGKKINLDWNQNNVTFGFSGISISSLGDMTYQYMLEGLDKSWLNAGNNEVIYSGLKPGKYTFKVRTISKHGKISKQTADQTFTIKAHYSESIWFLSLIIFLIIAAIFILIYLWFINYKRIQKRKLRALQLEQTALRNQMNPHFLFNTLNSIQQFVIKEDKRKANKYLVLFANLIRKYLDHSRELYITLGEEIESLEMYLQLENLRMNNQVEIDFHKPDQSLNGNYIPAMFVQPIVENAFKHVLFPLINEGHKAKLSIIVNPKDDNYIIFSVKDNGTGFSSTDINKDGSTAMRNIMERIEILNKVHSVNAELKFNSNQISGTEFVITLPILNKSVHVN